MGYTDMLYYDSRLGRVATLKDLYDTQYPTVTTEIACYGWVRTFYNAGGRF